MTKNDLPYLRQLMGDSWVDSHVLGDKSTHLLCRWQKKDPQNVWVPYTEQLVKSILTSKTKLDPVALAAKLEADYAATIAEMETAVFFEQQGFAVVLEPMAPEKGPDLCLDWEERRYFVEIRAVGQSAEDDRFDEVCREIFSRLKTVPSSYSVKVTVGDEYAAGSFRLRAATDDLIEALKIAGEAEWSSATLYHSASGTLLNPFGDLEDPGARSKYQEIMSTADFIARLTSTGVKTDGTSAAAQRPFKQTPEPDQSHERLKKILNKKRTQLPKDSRGIIVFDVTELCMLTDFSIECALYGDLVVTLPAPIQNGGPIGKLTARRNNRGFFRQTSRVSAVIFHKRTVENSTVTSDWHVYPTNRADADTIRLSLAELQRLGELDDPGAPLR